MSAPRTFIQSNGSKWAGDEPDTIPELLAVLARTPLDPMYERCGGFVSEVKPAHFLTDTGRAALGWARYYFSGNFYLVSHSFGIYTDDPDIFGPLLAAIEANTRTPAYQQAKEEREASRKTLVDLAEKKRRRDQATHSTKELAR